MYGSVDLRGLWVCGSEGSVGSVGLRGLWVCGSGCQQGLGVCGHGCMAGLGAWGSFGKEIRGKGKDEERKRKA